jgi:hypothetical protein
MTRIDIDVENYGQGGEGPHRAGMAIVRLNGEVVAKLRTDEGFSFEIGKPPVATITRQEQPPRPLDRPSVPSNRHQATAVWPHPSEGDDPI